MSTHPKSSIVLIYGLWMTPHSQQPWIDHFSKVSYTVLASGWPGVDGLSVADINKNPSALNSLTIHYVVGRYKEAIRGLETLIIMGHSFGGLFTQVLLSRSLSCAGIAISAGVNVLTLSTVKSIFPVLTNNLTFNYNGVIPLSASQFRCVFTNELSEEEPEKVYKEDHIPGSAHVLWQGALAGLHNSGDGEVI
jgi:non-heme chloroperoxidase